MPSHSGRNRGSARITAHGGVKRYCVLTRQGASLRSLSRDDLPFAKLVVVAERFVTIKPRERRKPFAISNGASIWPSAERTMTPATAKAPIVSAALKQASRVAAIVSDERLSSATRAVRHNGN